jgi:hypothetical protein
MSPFFWVALAVWIAAPAPAAGLGTMEGMPVEALFPEARFDPAIPTQRDVLGFEPGARPLRHDEILRYLRALDEASPRARLVEYARSYEGRELVYFAVGEPETIAALDSFREEHARRADPRSTADNGAAKAVAWIAYGIHGDELSSCDAAVAVAYRLVAGEDELAERLRRELVVLIDPLENPDGRDRFLAQTRSFAHATPNADPEDLSHTTVWPWGRGNHYLFDLNRDWFTMVQPESRRSEVIASWRPQLVVDSHEMGSDDTYLFSPARHPFNPFLPPTLEAWNDRMAADQAKALDRHGYPYYTREWNEEFFPGYGSSWASYSGAIGILYEMSGTEGTLVKNRVGRVRTYPQAVHHQTTSTIANLTTLAEHRTEVLDDYVASRRRAMTPERVAAWVLPRGAHPERTDRLAELLERQGVEVLAGRSAVAGATDTRTGRAAQIPDGEAYLVRLDQPLSPLVHQLLDPHIPMNAEFFREEREYIERGKGSRLYDVTAWSLPFAYDVEAYWTKTLPASAGWTPAEIPPPAGELVPTASKPFGFVIDGITDRSLPLLASLLADGIHVQVAEKPFKVAGHTWPRASLLVIAEGHPQGLPQRLAEAAKRYGVTIHAVPTAKAEDGPDLGGEYFKPLVAPRVGVWAGWPVSPSDFGALWHLFDQQLELRFNALDLGRFDGIDLARYNVLIFPPAFGEGYRAAIGDDGVKRLRSWIEAGGTAIGIGSGTEFLASKDLELTRTRLRSEALEQFPPVVLGPSAERAERAGPFRAAGVRAPASEDEDEAKAGKDQGKGKKKPAKAAAAKEPASPYDVAPILGDGARPFAEGHDQGTPVDMTPVDLAEWIGPLLAPGKDEPELEDLERADERLRAFSPQGAFLRVELDPEAWLGWGLGTELPALAMASDTLVAESPVDVAARFADLPRLHLGGLLWPEAAGRLARTAYATRESKGNGQIVLFLERPEFRGVTLGTRRLLVNAVLYGPGLGTRWSRPW